MTLLQVTVDVPYWWHASILEVLWLVGGVIALFLSLANVRDARKDEAILDDVRTDPAVHSRHYYMIAEAAKGRTADQMLTLANSTLIVIVGVIACAIRNPLAGHTTITSFAVTVALDGISLFTVIRSWSAMRRRDRLYELAAGRTSVIAAEMRAKHINDTLEQGDPQ